MTPGVRIEEKDAFPNSVLAVATAVPVFIGYTQFAKRAGKDLAQIPTRISSFAEYIEIFGTGFNTKFSVPASTENTSAEVIQVSGKNYTLSYGKDNTLYLYNSIRLFYANGGSDCYIMSVGTYDAKITMPVRTSDFGESVFLALEKEFEPTLVIIPDIIALGKEAYPVYREVLKHCAKMQNRIGIFDVAYTTSNNDAVIQDFKDGIGADNLNYGAAYYPWLNTTIVQANEIGIANLDDAAFSSLSSILPGTKVPALLDEYKKNLAAANGETTTITKLQKNLHVALLSDSPVYSNIMTTILAQLNLLPPSGAMAGIYALTDNTRGVWKAPANVSVNSVNSPVVNVSMEAQQKLAVDAATGKSINVIRPFPGIGTLVWGARTLDGNSEDWRYINVRRTLIMIEQSVKQATRAYTFEPNDANTWLSVKKMITNFLFGLWKEGALAGASPEQAFQVDVGLGSTMTANDILDGIMRISMKVAIVRPAEFIVITFQQQMQQS